MFSFQKKDIRVLDRDISILSSYTDCGIQVLIAGGDKSHIGSVSVSDPEGNISTNLFEGHKDHYISQEWAGKIYEKYKVPVVVSVGIHYDNLDATGIQQIVDAMKGQLELFFE